MGLCSNIYNYLIRILFSVFIVFLGLKGLTDANMTTRWVDQSINLLSTKLKMDLSKVVDFSLEIIFFQNFCLIFGGLLCLFRFCLRKFFISLGIVLFIVLVKNPFLYEEKVWCSCLQLIAILGASLFS